MVYYSYAADGVDVQGIEYAGIDAVAAPQTSIVAISLSLIESPLHCAGSDAVIIIDNLTLFAPALAFHYGHALYSGFSFKADDYRNILHNLFAGAGAVKAVKRFGFGAGFGKSMATRHAAAAAVGTWQQGFDFCYLGVFIDMKFLCDEIEHYGCYHADASEH